MSLQGGGTGTVARQSGTMVCYKGTMVQSRGIMVRCKGTMGWDDGTVHRYDGTVRGTMRRYDGTVQRYDGKLHSARTTHVTVLDKRLQRRVRQTILKAQQQCHGRVTARRATRTV